MRQNLNLKQGQSLVMTPQLQQAIKLLQMSNMEVAEFVAEELEKNPLLEVAEDRADANDNSPEEAATLSDSASLTLDETSGLNEARSALDAPSEDVFEAGTGSDSGMSADQQAQSGPSAQLDWSGQGSGKSHDGGGLDVENLGAATQTLHDHLRSNLMSSNFTQTQKFIATQLIDDTDDAGYCRADLGALAELLGVDRLGVEDMLEKCQAFGPPGIMARDVPECLALQLKERNRYDPIIARVLKNLDLVASFDVKGLAEICRTGIDDIVEIIAELKTLTPRPGAGFAAGSTIAVVPDVFIRELPNGAYGVELNAETLPRVLMNSAYYAEVSSLPLKDTEREFITECAATASWLVKSLDQRARTILKVSSEIVRQQDAFFAKGVAHLKPMNLKVVAEAIEMHESTISRVTSNKYMATPRGLFELKYFFTAGIPSTGSSSQHSAEAVRHHIKQLIARETIDNILSDDSIVDTLRGLGIDIARRTVAKYRESMNIPSSVKRRRVLRSQEAA